MLNLETLGRMLLIGGVIIAVVGGLLILANQVPFLQRFGSLPGDIRYESSDGRISCFAPIGSMLLLSIVLTIVLNVIIRLLNR